MSYFLNMWKEAFLLYLAAVVCFLLLLLAACGPKPLLKGGGVYSDPEGFFSFRLPGGWELVRTKEVKVALIRPHEATGIALNATPGKRDLPLPILVRHLLIGFEKKELLEEVPFPFQEREGMKAIAVGEMEGERVKMVALVLKGKGVVYDILFWTPHELFPKREGEFEAFLKHLKITGP